MRAAAIFLLACGCDRVFFLDHVEPSDDAADAEIDAPSLPVCEQPNNFCDDFDGPPPFADRWDRAVMSMGSTLSQSQATFVSSPASFEVALPLGGGLAYLEKNLATAAARLRVEMKLQVETSDSSAEIDLIALNWTNPPSPCTRVEFMLVTAGGPTRTLRFQETYFGCSGGVLYSLFGDAGTTFRHVVLEIQPGTPTRLNVNLDGNLVLDRQLPYALSPSSTRLRVGASFINNQNTAWRLRFDDVIADVD